MNSKRVFVIITLISIISINNFSFGYSTIGDTTNIPKQDDKGNFLYIRASAGIGRSSISFGDIAFLTVGLGNLFSSVRYCEATKFISYRGDTEIREFGFLVGLSYNLSFGYMSAGLGISKVTRYEGYFLKPSDSAAPDEFYPFVETSHSVVGLPIQVDLFYTPLDFLGIGFSYFLNVNSVYSISGYMICIQIGKLH